MQDQLIGRVLNGGEYVIREELGRGGMATVYRAYSRSLETDVAIKLLAPRLAADLQLRERFHDEARLLAPLLHPNLLNAHYFGDEGELVYIVMRLVSGGSLKDRLQAAGGRLDLMTTARLVRDLASALHAAHDQGVVHLDVKPGNVLMGRADWPLLGDMGIAQLIQPTTQATGKRTIAGTPAYMSPEQCRGDALDGRSDQYSLAVLTYELLTGQVPFEATTTNELMRRQIEDSPPQPRDLNPGLPGPVEAVVLRALAKEPAQRYPTIDAFGQALATAAERTHGMSLDTKSSVAEALPNVIGVLALLVFGPVLLMMLPGDAQLGGRIPLTWPFQVVLGGGLMALLLGIRWHLVGLFARAGDALLSLSGRPQTPNTGAPRRAMVRAAEGLVTLLYLLAAFRFLFVPIGRVLSELGVLDIPAALLAPTTRPDATPLGTLLGWALPIAALLALVTVRGRIQAAARAQLGARLDVALLGTHSAQSEAEHNRRRSALEAIASALIDVALLVGAYWFVGVPAAEALTRTTGQPLLGTAVLGLLLVGICVVLTAAVLRARTVLDETGGAAWRERARSLSLASILLLALLISGAAATPVALAVPAAVGGSLEMQPARTALVVVDRDFWLPWAPRADQATYSLDLSCTDGRQIGTFREVHQPGPGQSMPAGQVGQLGPTQTACEAWPVEYAARRRAAGLAEQSSQSWQWLDVRGSIEADGSLDVVETHRVFFSAGRHTELSARAALPQHAEPLTWSFPAVDGPAERTFTARYRVAQPLGAEVDGRRQLSWHIAPPDPLQPIWQATVQVRLPSPTGVELTTDGAAAQSGFIMGNTAWFASSGPLADQPLDLTLGFAEPPPTPTPLPTETPLPTQTPTSAAVHTATATATPIAAATATATETAAPVVEPTGLPNGQPTPTPTATPTPVPTLAEATTEVEPTPLPASTDVPTATPTTAPEAPAATPTEVPVPPTETPTPLPVPVLPTETPTPLPVLPTATPTPTPLPPTETPIPTHTPTPPPPPPTRTPTSTPTATATPIPTNTPTPTPTVVVLQSVSVTIVGNGVVRANAGDPSSCTTKCEMQVRRGTTVALTATPADGFTFSGWSGACSGAADCSISVDGNKNLTATFTQQAVAVAVRVSGEGSVSGSGFSCPPTCAQNLALGSNVSLTAAPGPGRAVNWDGCDAMNGNRCDVSVRRATTVFAVFVELHRLVVDVSGAGSVRGSGISCPSDCNEQFKDRSFVDLHATPASGWIFSRWTGACSGTAPDCTLQMDTAKSVAAVFVLLLR